MPRHRSPRNSEDRPEAVSSPSRDALVLILTMTSIMVVGCCSHRMWVAFGTWWDLSAAAEEFHSQVSLPSYLETILSQKVPEEENQRRPSLPNYVEEAFSIQPGLKGLMAKTEATEKRIAHMRHILDHPKFNVRATETFIATLTVVKETCYVGDHNDVAPSADSVRDESAMQLYRELIDEHPWVYMALFAHPRDTTNGILWDYDMPLADELVEKAESVYKGREALQSKVRDIDQVVCAVGVATNMLHQFCMLMEMALLACIIAGVLQQHSGLLSLVLCIPIVNLLSTFYNMVVMMETSEISSLDPLQMMSNVTELTHVFGGSTFADRAKLEVAEMTLVYTYMGVLLCCLKSRTLSRTETTSPFQVCKEKVTNSRKQKSAQISAHAQLNLKKTAETTEEDKCPHMLWFQYCQTGNVSKVREYLKHRQEDFLNKQSTDHGGDAAIHLVCRHNHESIVQVLLDIGRKKIDINLPGKDNETPLIICATLGHKVVLEKMFKSERLNLDDGKGEEAMLVAVERDHFGLAMMIRKKMNITGLKIKNAFLRKYLGKVCKLNYELSKRLAKNVREEKLQQLRQYKDLMLQKESSNTDDSLDKVSTGSQSILDQLKEYAECDICFDSMADSKIFACSSDHWMCEGCKDSAGKENCPFCKEDFRNFPPRRCHRVESVVKLIKDL